LANVYGNEIFLFALI